ncbi:DUF3267 domain-containing protein [Halobacteriaceae archaeon GCM10025711]
MDASSTSPSQKSPYEYPQSRLRLAVAVLILLVISLPGWPVIRHQTDLLLDSMAPISWTTAGLLMLGLFAMVPFTILLHEPVHYLTMKLLGYNPEIQWIAVNPNVSAPGQRMDATHNVISLLAPLVVLDAVALLVVFVDVHPVVSLVAAGVFVVNSLASANDVSGAWFDYRLPAGSQVEFRKENGQTVSYIYEAR